MKTGNENAGTQGCPKCGGTNLEPTDDGGLFCVTCEDYAVEPSAPETMAEAFHRLAADDAVCESVADVLFVAEEALERRMEQVGSSARSEASYWGDGDDARLRLASHDVVYAESDSLVCVGVACQDADVDLRAGMTSGEVRRHIDDAIQMLRDRTRAEDEDGE